MCRRFSNEDECCFYPDCSSCNDPESLDYLYPEEWESEKLIDAIKCGIFLPKELARIAIIFIERYEKYECS